MPLLLVVLFLVVPLVELYVIFRVGDVIGFFPTVALLLTVSVLGAALVRREGTRTWRAFRLSLGSGRPPAKEVADGALVILGGALLLTPGFVTDIVGLLLIVPVTRAVARRALTGLVSRRLLGGVFVPPRQSRRRAAPGARRNPHPVVEGEVTDDRTPPDDERRDPN